MSRKSSPTQLSDAMAAKSAAKSQPRAARDTLRPAGAFAAPPPPEAQRARVEAQRPQALTAAVTPSADTGASRGMVKVVGSRRQRAEQGAPRPERESSLGPLPPTYTNGAESQKFELLGHGLFLNEAPGFEPSLADELFGSPSTTVAPATRFERRAEDDEELPPVGAIVEKFRLEELLGVGGFAAVYRATHLLLGAPVAIKMLRPKLLQRRPSLARSLYEEARFAARISDPHVVRVLDVTHTAKITFVVMEYIDGISLSRLIQRGPLPARQALGIGLDVVAGLAAGLNEGLVHHDIKPANIMVTKNGMAKIVDFGLATPSMQIDSGESYGNAPALIGTAGYMAPETAPSSRLDFRADIYSLGVTLYEAVVGVLPFWAEDATACLRLQRECKVPEPDRVRPGVPVALSELLLWMLAKTPAERPQSYAELEQALRRVLSSVADVTTEGAK